MGILMEYIPPKGKKGKRLSVVLLVIACIGLIFAALLVNQIGEKKPQ